MKSSIRAKMICIIIIVAMLIASVSIVISYKTYSTTIDNYYKETITNIASTAGAMVDAEKIGLYADTLEIDEDYEKMLNVLFDIKENNDVEYLYIEKIVGNKAIAIMDADTENPMAFRETFNISDGADVSNMANGIPAFISNEKDVGWMCSVFTPIKNSSGEVVALVGADLSMNDVMNARYKFLLIVCIAIVLTTIISVIALIYLINRLIVNPVNKIAEATSNYVAMREKEGAIITADSLISQLKTKSRDEIGNLTESVKTMEKEINRYIENLTRVTAEKERIGAELNVATQIQASMLPSTFPAFPERKEFDIFASMHPAKEVGGDFYDFFFVDDDHFAMVMADVSGKGVPAALFMVIAKTLIKNCSQTMASPKDILEKVNKQLCENNEAEMFVTVWLGILEISTGRLRAANAGHEFPVLKKADGDFELVRDKHGFVLAGMETAKYHEYELNLNKGDKLYLYTDGVPESTNSDNELFGTDRMLASLNKNKNSSPSQLLASVRNDIDDFVKEAPQFDDITMMGVEIKCEACKISPEVHEISESISSLKIETVVGAVEGLLEKNEVPMNTMTKINIAIDEICSNIIQYSNAENVKISYWISNETVNLVFSDNGIRYNPLEKKDPDVTLPPEERQIGGLGIYMVKKSMDSVEYEYIDERNTLTLKKKY